MDSRLSPIIIDNDCVARALLGDGGSGGVECAMGGRIDFAVKAVAKPTSP